MSSLSDRGPEAGESGTLRETLEFAVALAREGGDFTAPFFYSDELQIDHKPDDSYVTEADRGAERLMRERLAERFPDDGIVGEEWGRTEGTSGRTWFLDPVDGTEAFVRGVPLYGTLVACVRDGEDVADAGVIYLPALSQIVFASRGGGAWWSSHVPRFTESPQMLSQTRRAAVSTVSNPAEACLLTTHHEWWERTGRAEVLARLLGSFGVRRMWGHCYAPFMVATGKADVWVEPSAHDWDFAPVNLIVSEAGGRATSVAGVPTFRGGSLVISNGRLQDVALRALDGF
ncbi:MAG: hypothetical protein O3B04_08420 [Chloroflexi bacterium]|nr:hypothetical protein [Chloroflexota bacterium]